MSTKLHNLLLAEAFFFSLLPKLQHHVGIHFLGSASTLKAWKVCCDDAFLPFLIVR